MRHLLAAALRPDPSSLARERVARGFWSDADPKNGTTVDLAARREAMRDSACTATTDDTLHFLSEE